MGEQLEATAELINDRVQFSVVTGKKPAVTCDYVPPLGDGEGYTGLEMLLMSLCACSGTSVLALLRQTGKNIQSFVVKGSGERREEHPTGFRTISLEFRLGSDNTAGEEIQKAIEMSAQSICPVWSMLKNNVTISTGYRITSP